MYPKEKQFADLLSKQKRDWVYHPKRFKVKDTHYEPDFFLPNENLYIEVIGTRQAFHQNKNKILKFKKLYPHIRFIIVDFNNNPFPCFRQKKVPKFKMIPYFDTYIPYQPGHRNGKCGDSPKLCETCRAINNYRRERGLKCINF